MNDNTLAREAPHTSKNTDAVEERHRRPSRHVSWAAGVFDSLGSVNITSRRGKSGYGRWYSLKVTVSVRQRVVADRLKAQFGGSIGYLRRFKKFFWTTSDRNAAEFLKSIKPYVSDKLDQIEIGLEFAAKKPKYRYLNMLASETFDDQNRFRNRLLEARGRLPAGTPYDERVDDGGLLLQSQRE